MTMTEERVADLRVGETITVRSGTGEDLYIATGRFVGLMFDVDGAKLQLLGDDQIERRIALPCEVTHAHR